MERQERRPRGAVLEAGPRRSAKRSALRGPARAASASRRSRRRASNVPAPVAASSITRGLDGAAGREGKLGRKAGPPLETRAVACRGAGGDAAGRWPPLAWGGDGLIL